MEQNSVEPNGARSKGRRRAASARLRLGALLERAGLRAVVLTRPPAVAWATGGVAPPVDRSSAFDLAWVVVSAETAALITSEVEAARVTEEYGPHSHGLELVVVPWFEPGAFVRAASEVSGAPLAEIAADGHDAFGIDATDDLISLRLALSDDELDELRALGRLVARSLGESLRSWRPDHDRDLDVQAQLVALVESGGADTPVVIVGGDDRVRRFRHPVAIGAPMRETAMAVVVARRSGLHVAATRYAFAREPSPEAIALHRRVASIGDAVLGASTTGSTYGEALASLDSAYARVGAPGAWREHYQGGPIGFQQREFEIAPSQRTSRWYNERIELGHALAWNPSLAGGAKVEDTYIVAKDGLERVTTEEGRPGVPAAAPAGPQP